MFRAIRRTLPPPPRQGGSPLHSDRHPLPQGTPSPHCRHRAGRFRTPPPSQGAIHPRRLLWKLPLHLDQARHAQLYAVRIWPRRDYRCRTPQSPDQAIAPDPLIEIHETEANEWEVAHGLHALSADHRQAILLVYFDDLTSQQAADRFPARCPKCRNSRPDGSPPDGVASSFVAKGLEAPDVGAEKGSR